MPYNGSGTFNLIYSWPNDAANGIKIRADRMQDQEQDMAANGFGNTITRDGQGSATANQPMNGFVHTGVGNATLTNEYAVVGQVQNNSYLFSVAGGTSDAITAAFTPATTLTDGAEHCVRAGFANQTTTPTYAPDGNTAHPITKLGGSALAIGDIAGPLHELRLRYNLANTRWELINPAGVQNQVNTNKLINGNFLIDQYSNFASRTLTTSNQFICDRWYARETGASVTALRGVSNLPFAAYQFTGSSSTLTTVLGYRIESADCVSMQQNSTTLSFYYTGPTGFGITYTISSANAVDNFSAVTTRQTQLVVVYPVFGWNRFSFNINGATQYANGCQIEISFGISGANSFSVAAFKLEEGLNATPPQTEVDAETLLKCQRYYQKIVGATNGNWILGQAQTTTGAQTSYNFSVAMRVAPTVTLPSVGKVAGTCSFLTAAGGYPTTQGTHSIADVSPTYVSIAGAGYGAATWVAGNGIYFIIPTATVTLSAEL